MRAALALAGLLLLVPYSQGTTADEASSPAESSAAASMESMTAASEAASEPPSAPSSNTPSASASASKPSAEGMATGRLADAVLDQLKIDSADTPTDQLITIPLSPLMRQFASTADITTRVDSDGPKVKLAMWGGDSTCVITVTDEPRARGVVCKTV